MLLSGHDSKKYQAALRLKKRIAENPAAFPDMGLLAETSEAREIDKFGEMAAKYVRKAQKRLTPEEIEEVIAEYLDGKTPTELGEKYGCHGATVSAILKRKGVNIRGHITEKADALIAGYQAGKSTYQLAEEFHCDSSTVSRILKQNGIVLEKCKAQKKLDVDKVISMYADMFTAKEIGQRFGVSGNAVIRYLREHGVEIRSRGGRVVSRS